MQTNPTYDVVICGAGLAGLTLARQLRQAMPSITIALVDRLANPLPLATFKVGEATTEIGSYYLADILGLRDYLDESHYRKLGLRFFFQNSGGVFHKRPEIGLTKLVAPYAYNIDRGLFESDLRNKVAADGVDLLEHCHIRDIVISSGADHDHEVVYVRQGESKRRRLAARWVIDAMGRRRFLQRKFGLTKPNVERCSAAWLRMAGRIDVGDLVSPNEKSWHGRVPDGSRYYSTNHLCGPGYWIWLIGLPGGYTSIGLVADEAAHPFTQYNSYPKLYRWLQLHEPVLASRLAVLSPEDFLKMPRYRYAAKQIFSTHRWASTGEAATFIDPLYSTGTDMIGLTNCLITQLIEKDGTGGFNTKAVEQANLFFLSFNDGLADNVSTAYSCMGHALAMAMKTIWDTMAGWAFTAPMLFNSLYLDTVFRQRVWPDAGRFFQLAHRVQQLFVDWAAASEPRGRFEFIDYLALPFVRELRRRNLQSSKSNDELLADHKANIDAFEEFAQVIFLLAVEDTMPHKLAELPLKPWLNAWAIGLNDKRWREDRLFVPASEPRDLRPMWELLRRLIEFPVPAGDRTTAVPAIVQRAPLKPKAGDPGTLPEALRRAAEGDKGLVYIQMDGTAVEQNYSELLQDAARICGGLRAGGTRPGDIVMLQLPLNQDLIPALWGCLLGGFTAVPVAVPLSYSSDSTAANRFRTAWAALARPLIVTTQTLGERFDAESTDLTGEGRRLVSIQQLRSNNPDDGGYSGRPGESAILLLTSGSTGPAKAVPLRHDSILIRAAGRQHHFNFCHRDVSANWFPLDHVAALVMFHMRDVYLGCRQVHAPTRLALENPLRWLDWLSRYRATLTWAPNFAYALVNDHANTIRRGNWDLSSLRCILNGGEPIDFNTASTFVNMLRQHGLRKNSMYPDWGMTEIASGVVCPIPIDTTAPHTDYFCLGAPIPGTAFRVVDDDNQLLNERQAGRVQVKGSTVTAGYLQDPERTSELFTADGWLDTGDLGFLDQGELTITGRNKDVLIINGINFSCDELENRVERLDGVRTSYTAACGIRQPGSQTDQLVIFFCSVFDQHASIAQQISSIREEITKTFGIAPHAVIPVSPAAVPKSSIGKIQRAELLQRLKSGIFDKALASFSPAPGPVQDSPATDIEQQIIEVWSKAFKTKSLGLHDSFFELGGHSLIAVQIIARLEESFGIEINIRDLFDAPTVHSLAGCIAARATQPAAVQSSVS